MTNSLSPIYITNITNMAYAGLLGASESTCLSNFLKQKIQETIIRKGRRQAEENCDG